MISEADPIAGSWYHYPRKAQKFFVTVVDEDAATVGIQCFDGTLGELALDDWYVLDIGRIEAPADWTGPTDNVEKDDLTPVGTEMSPSDWSEPFQELDEQQRAGPRTPGDVEGLDDDWGEGYPEEERWGGQ